MAVAVVPFMARTQISPVDGPVELPPIKVAGRQTYGVLLNKNNSTWQNSGVKGIVYVYSSVDALAWKFETLFEFSGEPFPDPTETRVGFEGEPVPPGAQWIKVSIAVNQAVAVGIDCPLVT